MSPAKAGLAFFSGSGTVQARGGTSPERQRRVLRASGTRYADRMGLDGVELVMECEDEFGISIPDAEASHVRTVADLHGVIMRLRGERRREPVRGCRSAAVFYRARRALVGRGVARERVRPGVTLRELMPRRRDVRRRYESLRSVLAGAMPRAERSPIGQAGMESALAVLACVAGASAAWAWTAVGPWAGAGVGAASAVAMLAAWGWLDSWVCTRVPVLDATVGELVRDQVAAVSGWGAELEAAEVFARLRAIVSEQLGVPIADVVPGARFVEDLRMD